MNKLIITRCDKTLHQYIVLVIICFVSSARKKTGGFQKPGPRQISMYSIKPKLSWCVHHRYFKTSWRFLAFKVFSLNMCPVCCVKEIVSDIVTSIPSKFDQHLCWCPCSSCKTLLYSMQFIAFESDVNPRLEIFLWKYYRAYNHLVRWYDKTWRSFTTRWSS